jgi:hypothetical protein
MPTAYRAWISCSSIPRRLYSLYGKGGKSGNETRLCPGSPRNKKAVGDSWFASTPYQGGMFRLNASRAPVLHHRHRADAILHCSPENSQGTRDGSLSTTTGKGRPSLGFSRKVAFVQRYLCFAVVANAMRSFLFPQSLRRYVYKACRYPRLLTEWRTLPPESPVASRPEGLETARQENGRRTTNPSSRSRWDYAYRCSRRGLWWHLGCQWKPWRSRRVERQGIWTWQDRADCISVRELKAIRMLLMGNFQERLKREGFRVLRLCVENISVKFVTSSFVAASRPMMRELRQLKRVLDYFGTSEWLPSILNKYADALSRGFQAGDLAIRRTLRHSVMAGM